MFTSCGDGVSRYSRAGLLAVASCCPFLGPSGKAEDVHQVSGRELFLREWMPNDARSHSGDGLGPQFNESSCVGCHNQGGPGGAGPAAKNVQLISVIRFKNHLFDGSSIDAVDGHPKPARPRSVSKIVSSEVQREREELATIHPDLRNANSIVLHRMSTAPGYGTFRRKFTDSFGIQAMMGMGMMPGGMDMAGAAQTKKSGGPRDEALRDARFHPTVGMPTAVQMGAFAFLVSERNTSALFGSGQIDSIPDAVLIAAAQRKFDEYPEVSGRVAKSKDGRLGRFGWKGQKATLRDFVLTACAVELGLNVPGEAQPGVPQNPAYKAPGIDLTEQECNAMVVFIANLPTPQVRTTVHQSERDYIMRGRERFDSVGCGTCHTPHLGTVRNIYSDLLLHDMGPELSDSGSYGGFAPNSTEDDEAIHRVPEVVFGKPKIKATDEAKFRGATRREWRTPPLWGVRDSAPYLHDGRAATLEQAIAMHGGEGSNSAHKYFELSEPERLQVALFLRALIAPQN